MKQSWQLIWKSMNTRNYHAHMGIRTCIQKYQNGNRYVPGQQTATRYHKTGLMDKHRLIICMPWSVADQSCMANKSIKRSISHEFTYGRWRRRNSGYNGRPEENGGGGIPDARVSGEKWRRRIPDARVSGGKWRRGNSGYDGRPEEMGEFRIRWASGENGGGGIPDTMGVRRKWRRGNSGYDGCPEEMAAGDYETHGDLRVMKINGNTSGMMDGDIGTLDETTNNKRKWVWGC
uniref:Uncharacterized protein n=1 Tax=Vitis vinifera TaxID=29760 RepID=A5BSW7_VITVI|nr:hypothetical protein VITISV_010337 [Vitis vinifera]